MEEQMQNKVVDHDDSQGMPSSSTIGISGTVQADSCRGELAYRLCRPHRLDLPIESSGGVSIALEDSFSFLPWKIRSNNIETHEKTSGITLLPSYLDLRRQQNLQFADEKCREAIISESNGDITKAKASYTQALDLIPSHIDSLIGYGKLLIKTGRFSKAENMLKSALKVDEDNVEVQGYLANLQERRQQSLLGVQSASQRSLGGQQSQGSESLILNSTNTSKQKNLTARKSSAYMDALMEKNLQNDLASAPKSSNDQEEDGSYGSKTDSHRASKKKHRRHRGRSRDDRKRSRSSKHRKRKRKEKKHKKRSSRRHSREDSSSDASSDSVSLSSYSSSSHSYYSDESDNSNVSRTSKDRRRKLDNNGHEGSDDDSSARHRKRRRRRHETKSKRHRKRNMESRKNKKKKRERQKEAETEHLS